MFGNTSKPNCFALSFVLSDFRVDTFRISRNIRHDAEKKVEALRTKLAVPNGQYAPILHNIFFPFQPPMSRLLRFRE